MRAAMADAEVGDDVFGEDPTVRALEEEIAALTGKESALFVTSGTMGNQLAIALQTRPGDEVIVGEDAHVVVYESGASPALSGVQFAVAGSGGLFNAAAMEARIQGADYWSPRTSLVCVENTHNRSGGRVFPQSDAVAIAERAHARGLNVHLDGARLWNASAATGLSIKDLAAPFDTASVCFSKGLGAPVGSALCMPRALRDRARRLRKMWGGGMRQSGILAAAALHALHNHREHLREDHESAKRFALCASQLHGARVDLAGVETNIVNVDLESPLTSAMVVRAAKELGLLINASGPQRLRIVTHRDATRTDVDRAAVILEQALATARSAQA